MPRIKQALTDRSKQRHPALVKQLVAELRKGKESGQPRIEETDFQNGAVRVVVLWDKWERVADDERADAILQAFEQAENKAYRDRIAIALGFTYPEAHELGMLPYKLEPSLEGAAPALVKEISHAMVEEGASKHFSSQLPELRFATEPELEAARKRLRSRFGNIWVLTKEMSPKGL